MTVIIAVTDGRAIHMAADSYAGNGYALQGANSKIVRRQLPDGTPVLFGTAGGMRGGILMQAMPLPERAQETGVAEYVCIHLVNAMRQYFSDAGFATKTDGREEAADLHMLIGLCGRLFAMFDDYSAIEPAYPYMAIGSGMESALCALRVTEGIKPIRRLEMVMDAVCTHHTYARPPYHFSDINEPPSKVVYVVGDKAN